jgi:hypothetical protein
MDGIAGAVHLTRIFDHQHLTEIIAGVAFDQNIISEWLSGYTRNSENNRYEGHRIALIQIIVHKVIADGLPATEEAHGVRITAHMKPRIRVGIQPWERLLPPPANLPVMFCPCLAPYIEYYP